MAALYDTFETPRDDLDAYMALVGEHSAYGVLDIGCGTGTFACLLAQRGAEVTAVDPAAASVELARRKPHADRVCWVIGDVTALPSRRFDLATMTGNVAQVFLSDEDWTETLRGAHEALRPGGHLVFEVRDPTREAWRDWTRERSRRVVTIPGGTVERWVELTQVHLPLVTFRSMFLFEPGGLLLESVSTLRFRSHGDIADSLLATRFVLDEVRDAPDRPGREMIFVAHREA